MKELWVSKYSPKHLNEYTFSNPEFKSIIREFVVEKSFPHLLLAGSPGTGKSTLAELLISACNIEPMDVLIIDGSKDNDVNTVRDRVINFVITSGFGDIKVVVIEEADRLSGASQDTLREVMVRYSEDARFILTANHSHKISPALKSRCGETINFTSLPYAGMVKRACFILDSESVEYDISNVESIIKNKSPDLRAVINTLQQRTVKGKLISLPTHAEQGSELQALFLTNSYDDIISILPTLSTLDLSSSYTAIYDALLQHEEFNQTHTKMDRALIAIAQYQYQHSFSADPVICVAALFAQLRTIYKS